MKVLVLAPKTRYDQFSADNPTRLRCELVFRDRNDSEAEILTAGADADALIVTPITPVSAELIAQMPRLKLIHSEGVGFDRIDLEAARARGIYVCNNAGCNAPAVAELSITMMSMLLHRTLWGDRMVRAGRQDEAVKDLEVHIPSDLSDSAVGLVGFGHIAKAAAERLRAYHSTLYYYSRHRRPPEEEREYGVAYLPLHELAERSDIVSLHLPANSESIRMIGGEFFSHMKPSAFLVNTGRGAVIDDAALCEAIRSGKIAGAALDCYYPEPATSEHPIVKLAAEYPDKLVLCPHQGGIAQSAFRKAHEMLFSDLQKFMDGQRPDRIVNGL
jgi:D-3-phosphoglycerate dehydrogenase